MIKVKLKIWDKDTGEIHYDSEIHSFTLQFAQIMCHMNKGAALVQTVLDTVNNAKTLISPPAVPTTAMDVRAASGVTTYGIVVGTSDAAESATDYALGTLIANGIGAGQLVYSSVGISAPVNVSGVMTLSFIRQFANGSGGTITIKEVGVYCESVLIAVSPYTAYFCIIRDTVGDIEALNGSTKVAQYIIEMDN